MINPQTTWTDFRAAFCNALDEAEKAHFLEAWQSIENKTVFYAQTFMPAVAKKLGHVLQAEKLRCDYAFLNTDGVPIIFAEAENNHGTASHEIKCLCCLTSPLKVLVLSCDWQASEKQKYLPRWCETIRTHHAIISMDCLYAVIVGEWDDSLEYSFTVINTAGTVIEESRHTVKP
jgi:hypothetical protein